MRIAIFDYRITRDNAIGGCHLRVLRALADEHDFTVFSVYFDNPRPDRIRWVRIPAVSRPLFLLFLTYHALAPLFYAWHIFRTGLRFDLIQSVESNLGFGAISYSHFCHRWYLKQHGKHLRHSGLRGWFHLIDHSLHAAIEPFTYSRAKKIVVPSRGLARELGQEFPIALPKIRVLPNAIDVERLRPPAGFQRDQVRQTLGFDDYDVVFLFVALGHFERKGLPILLDAITQLQDPRAKLLVVGGSADLIESYRARLRGTAGQDRVHFAGLQRDASRYLWAADAFAFPSLYETFSLAAYEAAAAGLPLLVPRLNGIEEIVEDGVNGFVIKQNVEDVVDALRRFLDMPQERRSAMGEQARQAVTAFNEKRFVAEWQDFYQREIATAS
jgi:glycosyltransferase involved in cell wall biosynthesis